MVRTHAWLSGLLFLSAVVVTAHSTGTTGSQRHATDAKEPQGGPPDPKLHQEHYDPEHEHLALLAQLNEAAEKHDSLAAHRTDYKEHSVENATEHDAFHAESNVTEDDDRPKKGGKGGKGAKGGKATAAAGRPSGINFAARWKEGASCSNSIGGLGTTVKLDEFGYLEVAELCCNFQMEFFITRVIISMGLRVCEQSGVMGLVPWYSCGDFQSLETLKEDIKKGMPDVTECPYVQWVNKPCEAQPDKCKGKPDGYHRRRICDKIGGYSGGGQEPQKVAVTDKSNYPPPVNIKKDDKVIKKPDGKDGGTVVKVVDVPRYSEITWDTFKPDPSPAPPPKTCMATFMNMGGATVMNTMVSGDTEYALDVACCNKCTQESECTFWVRKSGVAPGTACYLRKKAAGISNSLSYRGGWRKEKTCGAKNGCLSSFDYMSGTIVEKVGICGTSEEDLDQACCQKCRDRKDECEFWVRERGNSGYRACQLMKNPGSKSTNINYRGGWRQGCGDFGACHATFLNRAGSLIDKLGVCGEGHEMLDSACCDLCSKNEDCEFWTRESGSYGSQFCWLYKNANPNEAHSSTRRGGWNKKCADGDGKDQCLATFQTINGATVSTTRVCGKSDAALDTECCQKCKDNSICESWERERGSKGFRTCWLKRGSTRQSNNANRRGGYKGKTFCGDKYLNNNCRASFYDWGGSQLGQIRYVCGKTAAELDAHCCALCRNETLCTHWVRESIGSTTGEGANRPRACWLRRNTGNPSKNVNRRGGWRQGCGKSAPKCSATFQDRSGPQIDKVAVCGSDDEDYLDSQCCNLCAQRELCEFWVRDIRPFHVNTGVVNTSFCYLRKNAAVKPSHSAHMRGGWNRICGKDSFTPCGASFQEMHGYVVGTYRVCGRSDAQLDAECCDKCKQQSTCDFWIREKGSNGFLWCWARRKGNGRKSANANRRGGYKTPGVCGSAFVTNGCKASFNEMSGSQIKIEFVCGKNDAEMDAMCCALCRNESRCEFWVRETREPTDPPTRPKMCWLRWNAGSASKNLKRRGGWREGCDNKYTKCVSTFTDRSGPLIDKRGVCGNGTDGVPMDEYLDSACCDLCAKNKDCEFWVRETAIPMQNNTFCYLRKTGSLTETVRTNKRGGWNRICGNPNNPACGAIFQEIHSYSVATFRVCGKTDAQLDAECCAKCKANSICTLWVRENGKEGWRWCWLRRNGNGRKSANNNRRGGYKAAAVCGEKFLSNKCKSSFDHVGGSQVGYDFVCGNTPEELDAMCCAKCRNNTRCEFWVRQSGDSGIKQCWLRMNPGGISKNAGYRGGWRQGCGAQGVPKCEATFTDWNGGEVNRYGVCGDTELEMDSACCALCAKEPQCEFWTRDYNKNSLWPSALCYLRKTGSTERVVTNRRGGWKACATDSSTSTCGSTFMEMSGPQVAVSRVCGSDKSKLDAACCANCEKNPACHFWVREAGDTGYRYCWLRRNPGGSSNNNNRRGGMKDQNFPACAGTFGDMSGPQVAAYTVWGESDAVLDAACCDKCRKLASCAFWVRDYRKTFPSSIGGKTCWLRRSPNFNSRSASHPYRRGGMKPSSLLQDESAEAPDVKTNEGDEPAEEEVDPDLVETEGHAAETIDANMLAFLQTGSSSTHSTHLWTQADANAEVDEEEEKRHWEEKAKAHEEAEKMRVIRENAALNQKAEERAKMDEEQKEKMEEQAFIDEYNADVDVPQSVHESGSRASMDEKGYRAVAALKDDNEMAVFIRRASQHIGLEISSEPVLRGIVPYYSGKVSTQTFETLLLELEKNAYDYNADGDKWIAPENEAEVPVF